MALELIFDIDDPQQAGLLSSFAGTSRAIIPSFVRGDQQLAIKLRPVKRSIGSERAWDDDHVEGDIYRASIGNADLPPSLGTFDLAIQGITFTGVAYNISAAALKLLINAQAPAILVDVILLATGVYQIDGQTDGAMAAVIIDATKLLPMTAAVVSVIAAGDGSTKASQIVSLRQAPVVYAEPSTEFDAAAVTVTTAQAATSTVNKIIRIAFTEGSYGGNYSITVLAGGVSASCGNASPSMTAAELAIALTTHPSITDNDITVTKSGGDFLVEFIGALSGSSMVSTINDATIANPSVLTTVADHGYKTGDSITITGSTGTTPSLNGTYTITVTAANKFSIPLNVTAATAEAAIAFNNTEPTLTAMDVDLLAPAGVSGVINLNTVNLYKAFYNSTAQSITFFLSIERERASGEIRTPVLVPVVLKRDIIDVGSLVALAISTGAVLSGIFIPRRVTAAQAATLVFRKGELATISDTDEVVYGNEAESERGFSIQRKILTAFRTADSSSREGVTTPAADTVLTIPGLTVGSHHLVEALISIQDGANNSNFKLRIPGMGGPGGLAALVTAFSRSDATSPASPLVSLTIGGNITKADFGAGFPDQDNAVIHVRGIIVIPASGKCEIFWSQNVSATGDAFVMQSGSFISAQPL